MKTLTDKEAIDAMERLFVGDYYPKLSRSRKGKRSIARQRRRRDLRRLQNWMERQHA